MNLKFNNFCFKKANHVNPIAHARVNLTNPIAGNRLTGRREGLAGLDGLFHWLGAQVVCGGGICCCFNQNGEPDSFSN